MSKDDKPENGLTTTAYIVSITDGDTVMVEVRRRFPVRITHPNPDGLDFNSPEKNTPEGQRAIEFLAAQLGKSLLTYREVLKEQFNKEITLFIPTNDPLKLTDINSFNRLVGEIWLDKRRLSDIMIEAGHAKLQKRGHYQDG